MNPAPRVVLVRGEGGTDDGTHDGVADYTGHLAAALRDDGLAVDEVPVGAGPTGAVTAARAIRALRPDVVHAQFAPSAFGFAPWTGLLLPDLVPRGVPWVTTLHEFGRWSTPSWAPTGAWDRIERFAPLDRETGRMIARSRAVLATNDGHARTLRERLGVVAEHAPLVPNVLPTATVTSRRTLGIDPDAVLVTFFGFLHPVKGLRFLVDAVAALRAAHPRLHLLLLGGHASRALPAAEAAAFVDELRTRAAGRGIADAMTITGYRPADEVSALLAATDVAVFPETAGTSTKSGALLSAFAHRLPCVVTAPPTEPRDPVLVDGRTVVVADRVRDPDSLAGALDRLLTDPALRARVVDGACGVAAGRTWPVLAAAHHALYRRLAG